GDSVLGDSVLGDSVLGDSVLGDSVLGDCVLLQPTMKTVTANILGSERRSFLIGMFFNELAF
ncbi:MAG: hypothetical protein VB814_03685, partial [Pirellulaceae bacterium]